MFVCSQGYVSEGEIRRLKDPWIALVTMFDRYTMEPAELKGRATRVQAELIGDELVPLGEAPHDWYQGCAFGVCDGPDGEILRWWACEETFYVGGYRRLPRLPVRDIPKRLDGMPDRIDMPSLKKYLKDKPNPWLMGSSGFISNEQILALKDPWLALIMVFDIDTSEPLELSWQGRVQARVVDGELRPLGPSHDTWGRGVALGVCDGERGKVLRWWSTVPYFDAHMSKAIPVIPVMDIAEMRCTPPYGFEL